MQIFIKTFNGITMPLIMESTDSIQEMKSKISETYKVKHGIEVREDEQILAYASRNLEGEHSLEDYNISDGATVHLSGRIPGGYLDVILCGSLSCTIC